jgi:hypothetical protein
MKKIKSMCKKMGKNTFFKTLVDSNILYYILSTLFDSNIIYIRLQYTIFGWNYIMFEPNINC